MKEIMPGDKGKELMLRFQGGEEDAFRDLFHAYKDPVHHFIYRYFHDADLAAELTQEVFLRIYKARAGYRPIAPFSTWLFHIAAHLCLNTLRSRKRETPLDISPSDQEDAPAHEHADTTTPSPDQQAVQRDSNREVAEAIQKLPENQ